jgi:hypothetical protein
MRRVVWMIKQVRQLDEPSEVEYRIRLVLAHKEDDGLGLMSRLE